MKNILLLTDFTDKSENAHDYALQLFTGQSCDFHLLSVQKFWEYTMDDLMVANPKDDIASALLNDNKSDLQKTKEALILKSKDEDFNFHTMVDYDVFTSAVNDAVKKYHIDLIICGTDGKSGIIEYIFNSHTLRIIRNTDCPVLAVPTEYSYEKPTAVQFILDYDDIFDECGKVVFLELVSKFRSTINVMRFSHGFQIDPINYREEREAFIKFCLPSPVIYELHKDQEPLIIIKKSLSSRNYQLQAISVKSQSFLERMISESHLSEIVNAATLPLLVLRDCNS
ncbi:universal stress protein [Nonlabens ulvanivorans]|uniref:Nucleotide-binding universal stress UspA family protein n=1 Tax=Nonlabens ulvanivorans TaxID=906888 RepID=A0A084JZN8_NONUL|nr:universal stress protein [Nonlabens ulvanivorans]KEZ94422.1 universal stress protein UspA [Nonlabens ulvanivorans]PRX12316.1 nucleotide-binding universal stress UspA family protein [Nonlabens ulvanivorans]